MLGKTFFYIIIGLVILMAVAWVLQLLGYFGSFTPTIFKSKESLISEVTIGRTRWQVDLADTTAKRALGLGGRDSLASDRGMLFIFGSAAIRSFWMKGMKFPIDIIWIKKDEESETGRVVGFVENADPSSFAKLVFFESPEPVDRVLEVNAGQVAQFGIGVGQKVIFK